ncbi:restriction endonuclease, partial [Rhizobium ruizarguesonis]
PDFEDLVRDLLGKHFSVTFEAFSAGPDQGIDGRHSKAGKTAILQAKHYAGSPFPTLKAAMKKERSSIDALHPDKYLL